MSKVLRALILVTLLGTMIPSAPPVAAASPSVVVVTWGDTLYAIAARTGTSVDALIRANGLPNPNFIYAGQRLVVPGASSAPSAPAPVNVPTTSSVYVGARGDTLATVAARFGTTIAEVMRVNGLYNPNFIYTGQRLQIPGRSNIPAPQPATAPAPLQAPPQTAPVPAGGKWIDVSIGAQTITAYEGNMPVKSVLVSTGLSWTPTPIGRYAVYMKLASQTMSGPGYYLPGVPWVMYFAGANAIHGTYWHNNFGHPMSHGCVNLTIADAKWFYDWAAIGTPVISHP